MMDNKNNSSTIESFPQTDISLTYNINPFDLPFLTPEKVENAQKVINRVIESSVYVNGRKDSYEPFQRVVKDIFPSLYITMIGAFHKYGYHAFPLENLIDGPKVSESVHWLEHAKAGFYRDITLSIGFWGEDLENKNLRQRDSIDEFKKYLFDAIGVDKLSDEQKDDAFDALKKLYNCRYDNGFTLETKVELDFMISFFHDIAENLGKATHEENAKKFVLQHLGEDSNLRKRLESIKIDCGNGSVMNGIDYILIGIEGTKVSTQIPPVDFDDDMIVTAEIRTGEGENDTKDLQYTISKNILNSPVSKFLLGSTEVKDWERSASTDQTSVYVFEKFKDHYKKNDDNSWGLRSFDQDIGKEKCDEIVIEHIKILLGKHSFFTLIAESLISNKINDTNSQKRNSQLEAWYDGNLWQFLTTGFDFINKFVREKTLLYEKLTWLHFSLINVFGTEWEDSPRIFLELERGDYAISIFNEIVSLIDRYTLNSEIETFNGKPLSSSYFEFLSIKETYEQEINNANEEIKINAENKAKKSLRGLRIPGNFFSEKDIPFSDNDLEHDIHELLQTTSAISRKALNLRNKILENPEITYRFCYLSAFLVDKDSLIKTLGEGNVPTFDEAFHWSTERLARFWNREDDIEIIKGLEKEAEKLKEKKKKE